MKANVNEIWELIDTLTLEEKKIIYKRMQSEINEKLTGLLDKVNERTALEPITLKEITDEVEKVRGKNYEQD